MKVAALIYRGLIVLLMTLFVVSCGVTETGNPKQPGATEPFGEPQDDGAEATSAAVYENAEFGIEISYPAGWSFEESQDGMSVDFMSADSSATITFEILDPPPGSLSPLPIIILQREGKGEQ